MNWQIVGILLAAGIPLSGFLNAYLLNQVRIEIGTLKLQMAEVRAKDWEESRMWIEAEFMRKTEVISRIETIAARVDRVENRRRDAA